LIGWIFLTVYIIGAIAAAAWTWQAFEFSEAIQQEHDEMMVGAAILMGLLLMMCVAAIWPALVAVGAPTLLFMKALGAAVKADRAMAAAREPDTKPLTG
jgi:hypothetical protein